MASATGSGTLLAVSLVRSDPPLAGQVRSAVAAGAELVELRVDLIGEVERVAELLRQPHPVPYILTIRPAHEGGAWDGGEADRIALIERLGLLAPGFVDVELSTWARSANVRQKVGLVCRTGAVDDPRASTESAERSKNRLILSHHDHRATPGELDAVFDALAAVPAAIGKAVFAADDATDCLRVLEQLARRGKQRPLIALALGEAGAASRVLARKLGAFLSFAALQRGAESAAGQSTVAELRQRFGWDSISPGSRVYGLVGWPTVHSRGPDVHNAAMRTAGIDGVYVTFPVQPTAEHFAAFMARVDASRWLDLYGLSVTIPHKEHALQWLKRSGGRVSQTAMRCGAVNTLWRGAAGWEGDNTDATGVLAALNGCAWASRGGLRGKRAAILGAGGVARAVLAALVEQGCEVTVFNRSLERAAGLSREFACSVAPWGQRVTIGADLVVNCTSVGMHPDVDATPLPAGALRPEMLVFDTVYAPAQTRLVREAGERGCATLGGVELFLAQAAEQFERWHGCAAPRETMRSALGGGLQDSAPV